MGRALEVARCVGAAGFIVAGWLSAVCNVPALCGWLAATSWLFAAVVAAVRLRSRTAARPAVLGRTGGRLLLLTAGLHLAGIPLTAAGAGSSAWQPAVAGGLDLLAWGWALYGALAVARWWWEPAAPAVAAARFAPRHLLLSALIVTVLGLQVAALFKHRPTWWPFIDYPLYGRAHGPPIRAVHHRLHGVTDGEPPALVEISADALGMSWFVYHTQLLPRMFGQPSGTYEEIRRALLASDLPPLTSLMVEATLYVLEDGELRRATDLRRLAIVPTAGEAGMGARDDGAAPARRGDDP